MKEIIPTPLGLFTLLRSSSLPLTRKVGLEDICGLSATLCVVLIIVIIILVVILIVFLIKEVFNSSNQQTTIVQTPQQQPPPQQTRTRKPIPPPSYNRPPKDCPDCGERMRYIEEHSRWFCENCKEYKWMENRST